MRDYSHYFDSEDPKLINLDVYEKLGKEFMEKRTVQFRKHFYEVFPNEKRNVNIFNVAKSDISIIQILPFCLGLQYYVQGTNFYFVADQYFMMGLLNNAFVWYPAEIELYPKYPGRKPVVKFIDRKSPLIYDDQMKPILNNLKKQIDLQAKKAKININMDLYKIEKEGSNKMTNLERLKMEIKGIDLTDDELTVYLLENGLTANDVYVADDKLIHKNILRTALSILESIANNPTLMKEYKTDDITVTQFSDNLNNRIDSLDRKIRQMSVDDTISNDGASFTYIFKD